METRCQRILVHARFLVGKPLLRDDGSLSNNVDGASVQLANRPPQVTTPFKNFREDSEI